MRPQKTIPFLSLAATPWWGMWLAAPPIGFLTSLWCPYGYSCASGTLCSRLLFSHVHWPCHLGEGFSYVSALGTDPFDFFINSRLRVWGREVAAWVEALLLRSLLVDLCPVLLVSAGSLWGRSLYALSLVSPDSLLPTYQIRHIVRFLLY